MSYFLLFLALLAILVALNCHCFTKKTGLKDMGLWSLFSETESDLNMSTEIDS